MKNASHQFEAFGGGTVVVPGVRAAAGKAVGKAVSSHAVVPGVRAAAGKAGSSQSSLAKAVSRQSSLGSRIFSSALVDCKWLRLPRCESLCFYPARMSLYDFLARTPHHLRVVERRPPYGRPVCVLCFVCKRDPWLLRFSSAVAATAFSSSITAAEGQELVGGGTSEAKSLL